MSVPIVLVSMTLEKNTLKQSNLRDKGFILAQVIVHHFRKLR